jgi:hypothetical protein
VRCGRVGSCQNRFVSNSDWFCKESKTNKLLILWMCVIFGCFFQCFWLKAGAPGASWCVFGMSLGSLGFLFGAFLECPGLGSLGSLGDDLGLLGIFLGASGAVWGFLGALFMRCRSPGMGRQSAGPVPLPRPTLQSALASQRSHRLCGFTGSNVEEQNVRLLGFSQQVASQSRNF